MTAYSWLTTPRVYLLYRDSMVINYGMPRTRVISFAEISHAEILAMPMGERLRIRMVAGKRLMLMMRDPNAFRGHLEDALSRYHGEQSGEGYVEGAVLNRGNEPEFDAGPEFEPEPGALLEPEAPVTEAGSYSIPEDDQPAATETYPGHVEEASSASGSYTEAPPPDYSGEGQPAPDYSGEGQPAYDASVDADTGRPEDDSPDRPRSPY